MAAGGLRDDVGGVFLGVGVVVVITLVTLPFVGGFFAAALVGGALVAAVMLWWRVHARH